MAIALVVMTEEEVSRCVPAGEESSFGALSTGKGHLPLQAMDVQATLEGLLAHVELAQTFVNTFDEPLEATYVFPLPDRAAVTRFRLDVGGRVVEGVLQERGAARRQYDQAIVAGHRAAIAEEDRPGVFTLRVGNILPGESARIRLSLSGPLIFDAGEVTFRFPLVVASRYMPGRPLSGPNVGDGTACDTDAAPDASRISPPVLLPNYPNPVRLSLSVDVLPTQLTPQEFRCSLHSVFMQRDDTGRTRFQLQPGERLNRDFVLRYQLGAEAVQTSLQLVPDSDDPTQGTYLLTLLPPSQSARFDQPRDIVFVLDRSGSMGGWKIVAARRAVAHMVDSLTERDRFNVYAFDGCLETPPAFGTGLLEASPRNRSRALEYLWDLSARGGTEMLQPLDQAVRQLTGARDRVLVLITDGQVGNEDQILHALGQRLQGIRIFTLGIDQAVNEAFLKRLAGLGGGSCDVVESENRLDEVMYKVHRRIGTPTLSQIQVEMRGLESETETLVPRRKLDLFAGVPVTLLGRYRGAPEGAALVRATDEAGRPWMQTVAGRCSHHPAAGVLWARGRIRELEDQFATGTGNLRDLERLIIETSLRFSVLCRFTAYVAVDKAEVVNEGGQQHKVIQAVEAPLGWEKREAILSSRAVKKTMLAKQVLEEMNASGRVSKKTMLTAELTADAADELAESPSPSLSPPTVPSNGELAKLHQAVQKHSPPGPDIVVTMGVLPAKPRFNKAIACAIEEAHKLKDNFVDTEHLLLGLLHDQDSEAVKVLHNLGCQAQDLRQRVLRLAGKDLESRESALAGQVSPSGPGDARTTLTYDHFTERARKVIQLAHREAQRLNHELIGTEHVLVGLVNEGTGIAARVLREAISCSTGDQSVIEPDHFSKALTNEQKQVPDGRVSLLGRSRTEGVQDEESFRLPGDRETESADPLGAYRKHTGSLRDQLLQLRSAALEERLRALGVLAVKLGELLDDMRSILPANAIPPSLTKLQADLQALLGQEKPDVAEIEKTWKQAEKSLREFAQPGAATTADREASFWK